MRKTKEIAKAWLNVLSEDEGIKLLAEERMVVCQACPHKAHFDLLDFDYCGVCHCPLLGKTHSPENSCPHGYWKK